MAQAKPESLEKEKRKTKTRNLDPEFLNTKTYLDPKEAAAHGPYSESTLAKLRCYGGGPEYIRVSARKVVYKRETFDAWLNEKTRATTYRGTA